MWGTGMDFGVLSTAKAMTLLSLGMASVFVADVGDPSIERYVSLGVGGVLAATIFYFYRQLAAQAIEREKQSAKIASDQLSLVLAVVQENTKTNTSLQAAVSSFHSTMDIMVRDQRDRYEQGLRDAVEHAKTILQAQPQK